MTLDKDGYIGRELTLGDILESLISRHDCGKLVDMLDRKQPA